MKKNEQRGSPRTPIKMTVRITFNNDSTSDVETWDISDGGIAIQTPENSDISWDIGMTVLAKVQGLPVEGPELHMQVVRITDNKIGLKVMNDQARQ